MATNWQGFVFGGIAGSVATLFVQPLDTIKVRRQEAVDREVRPRLGNLYRGIEAALFRQLTYTGARLGLFRTLCEWLRPAGASATPFLGKALAGLSAGGLASMVCSPADWLLVQMQSRKNAEMTLRAVVQRQMKQHGVWGFWQGAAPTVLRAMLLNLAMLSSYDHLKEHLECRSGRSRTVNQVGASAISGLLAATIALPADRVKTFMQLYESSAGRTGVLQSIREIYARHGWTNFYKGYIPFCFRIAPHAAITLLVSDELHSRYAKRGHPHSRLRGRVRQTFRPRTD